MFYLLKKILFYKEPSWSSSLGSWIYNYLCNQCQSQLTLWDRILLRRGVLDTTLCDQVATGRWFSPGTPISSTNKADRHDRTEILLKVALNTIIIPITISHYKYLYSNCCHELVNHFDCFCQSEF